MMLHDSRAWLDHPVTIVIMCLYLLGLLIGSHIIPRFYQLSAAEKIVWILLVFPIITVIIPPASLFIVSRVGMDVVENHLKRREAKDLVRRK